MKTNEIIAQITSLELDIANLDKPDFRELHGLNEEDVKNIKEELKKQVAENRSAAEEKINFILGQRRKKQGYIAANNEEIVALQQSNESHQADIKDWYDALDKKGKERYAGVITVVDNEKELKIN